MIHLSEDTRTVLFIVLQVAILLGSLGVVLLSRIIYSALLLGFVFICVALLYLLLNADFLAAAQVLIYVGAVNVLIVFAIMLVNKPDYVSFQPQTLGEKLSAFTFSTLFVLLTVMIFTTSWYDTNSVGTQDEVVVLSPISNVQTIGVHLLTDLLVPFELLSLLLLVALVGAITIASKNKLKEQ
uniref:NAD(P)H-quinone oxidoreductase subunit 6, chloroplastic n=1 Tax=Zygnema circumcarinatum TaxID=35869 RepID=A0A6N0GXE3_ZYGCR|nr:subunit 6 of NADH-plastoquinone oxidoreductase [Zygnema circumcarinatum]